MKPLRTYPDVERLAVDYLSPLLAARGYLGTVAPGVPSTWTQGSPEHVQVDCDGTPTLDHPVRALSTLRVTAWSQSRTRSKQLVGLCLGLLAAHPGGGGVVSVRPLTGVLPARDPDTRALIASVTARMTVHSIAV